MMSLGRVAAGRRDLTAWRLRLLLCLLALVAPAHAAPAVWRPAAGRPQVAIWPSAPPGQSSMPGSETADTGGVTNVSQPTMTIYAPRVSNTGAAVVVLPGGGFQGLAMGLEGTEVCDWLTSRGVTCVLLKYRVPSAPYDWRCRCRPHNHALSTSSLQDAQRTLRLVRARAPQLGVDPRKVGVIGFSAGGYLVAEVSNYFDVRLYPPSDPVDRLSSRPDFAMAIYPGHLAMKKDDVVLNPVIASHITARTPPTFLLQNEDDRVDSVEDALSYYIGLKKAGVPVELHSYAQGGHAFGLRPSRLPVSRWPLLADRWMQTIGVLGAQPPR